MSSNNSAVIFGFGSQGSAQAKNLRDSGWDVTVCLRPGGRHIEDANKSGIKLILDAKQAVSNAKLVAILINDSSQKALYNEALEKNLPKNAALIFAHGFAIHYEKIVPRGDLDIILVAPLAHGATVRSDYKTGRGTACLVAVAQNATGRAKEIALSYAKGISPTGSFIESSFAEEVESDLFVEQAVLCGGMPELVRAAFDVLVKRGVNPDIAYHSCLKELRAIISLMDDYGIAGMRDRISATARFGAITRGKRIVDAHVKATLESIFDEIKSGKFALDLDKNREVKNDENHLIERVHKKWNPPPL